MRKETSERGPGPSLEFYASDSRSWQIRLICRDIIRNMYAIMYNPKIAKDSARQEELRKALELHRKKLDELGITENMYQNEEGRFPKSFWEKKFYVDPVITTEAFAGYVYALSKRQLYPWSEVDRNGDLFLEMLNRGETPSDDARTMFYDVPIALSDVDIRLHSLQDALLLQGETPREKFERLNWED
ncbi:hypothetical protein M1349_02135 [Patescibacteria group bacterium]|nr:hypothetical protein [Patescibacteria group bacterium]